MNAKEKLEEVTKILLSTFTKDSDKKEVEEVKLAKAKLKDGSEIEADSFEVGSEVHILVEGESVLATEGEYELEDGSFIVVSAEGVISEVKPVPEEEEAPAEGSEEVEAEEVPAEEVPAEEESTEEEEKYVSKEEFDALKELVESMSQMMPMLSKLKEEKEAEQIELSKDVEEIKHSPEALVDKKFSPFSQKPQTRESKIWKRINE